jgi:hypothetical protein
LHQEPPLKKGGLPIVSKKMPADKWLAFLCQGVAILPVSQLGQQAPVQAQGLQPEQEPGRPPPVPWHQLHTSS